MKNITQGTMVYGIRSGKYFDILTYGLIISAACDLAQDKIDKIYYLTVIPTKKWIYSDSGFEHVISECIANIKGDLKNKICAEGLDWETVITLSKDEYTQVLESNCKSKSQVKKLIELFDKYFEYITAKSSIEKKGSILKNENKSVKKCINNIIEGKYMHYLFLPSYAFENKENDFTDGMIIDFQELDYFKRKDMDKLCTNEIDRKVLNKDEIKYYNNQFFILDDPEFAMIQGNVKSPWIEYVMQRFSNYFTRIGVDNLESKKVSLLIDNILKLEK